MNENNDSNITQAEKIIETLDLKLEDRTQLFLAQLYNSEYGVYLAKTYFGVPLANLIAAFLALFFFLFLRKMFTTLTIKILQPLTRRTETFYDDRVLYALKGPISFLFVIIGVNLFFALLFLETELITKIINSMIMFNIFWVVLALTHAFRDATYHFTSKFNPELAHEMGNFMLSVLRGIIVAIGLGSILQIWGINVAGLVAGLGIGGLAFALAAKDTAANLFGSIALLLDKSIRIGEWIRIDGVEGIVEDIGMRTTKIRAFNKSLITLPNQMIANSPIENFSRRKTRRIKMKIGVTYNTTSQQMENILLDIKTMLRNHEGISQKSTMLVNFISFDDSSLGILIYTFSNTAVWAKYMNIKEDVNLKIMKIIEENKSEFAFPSQSLYVESLPK
ncbi:Potassium efflux system KefA protein / Small-conductance mechanosensitive channel [hydrothermal vent metagenome]|uniref:Potassium efflux system KefA protein / Small-conductance mechanosensitive channel n=1 Tax=hydrothermal vent metagenome TaxID=652676 RepID=A0A1W1BBZ2_9ZZZZ